MSNISYLPLIETVSKSFTYLLRNFKTFLKICSVFLILWIADLVTGHPILCNFNVIPCSSSSTSWIMNILMYLAATIVSVEIIRHIILKQEYQWGHLSFGMNNIRYIAYNMLIALMVILPSALMLMIALYADSSNVSRLTSGILRASFIVTLIGLSVFCCRLYLVYVGAAIGNRSMSLGRSYLLTAGNMLLICIGQMLLAIPTIILVYLCYGIYSFLPTNELTQGMFAALILLCYFFDAALKASYYSHLYQFFTHTNKRTTKKSLI